RPIHDRMPCEYIDRGRSARRRNPRRALIAACTRGNIESSWIRSRVRAVPILESRGLLDFEADAALVLEIVATPPIAQPAPVRLEHPRKHCLDQRSPKGIADERTADQRRKQPALQLFVHVGPASDIVTKRNRAGDIGQKLGAPRAGRTARRNSAKFRESRRRSRRAPYAP